MSKETSNTAAELMKMPHHIVMGIFGQLQKIFKEEEEAQKKAEDEAKKNYHTPSSPSMPSMPNLPHF